MKKNNVSMIEIAKLSGVSIATVSRVLNHNGRFSAETEKRVMDVVNKYGYTINPNAQGLRTNHSHTIGVIIPDITNEYFAQVVRAIEGALINSDYIVFVCDTNENVNTEDYHIKSLVSKGVDGIIYISARKSVNEIKVDFDIPVVYIDRSPGVNYNTISSDNVMGGFLAAEELIKAGCKKIIMLRDENQLDTMVDRINGYKKALDHYGYEIIDGRIISCSVSYESAYKTITEIINCGMEFDGVFCATDIMALGALNALKKCNKKVPQEIKVIGFDGTRLTEISEPPISTVVQNTEQIGERAVGLLLKMIGDKSILSERTIVPVTLSSRESTRK